MQTTLLILFMLVGYGIALFFIIRALIIGFSLKKGRVPYVPVDKKLMAEGVDALALKTGDRLVDIGSGDGRVIFYVAKRFSGVQCVGIEINQWLVLWSQFRAFVGDYKNVKFVCGDALDYEKYYLGSFNKVFMYLTLDLVEKINPLLAEKLKPGSIVVSCKFGFGTANFKADKLGISGSQIYKV